jgi:hypothetical protein
MIYQNNGFAYGFATVTSHNYETDYVQVVPAGGNETKPASISAYVCIKY